MAIALSPWNVAWYRQVLRAMAIALSPWNVAWYRQVETRKDIAVGLRSRITEGNSMCVLCEFVFRVQQPNNSESSTCGA